MIHFIQSNAPSTFTEPTTLLDLATAAGLAVRADCGGNGICGKCEMLVRDNDNDDTWRSVLACQTNAVDGMTIDIPPATLLSSQIKILTDYDSNHGVTDGVTSPIWDFFPDIQPPLYALALDIGTTTLALEAVAFDTSRQATSVGVIARENPQKRRFGDDIISRIQAVISKPSALREQQRLLVEAVNAMTDELIEASGGEIKRDRIMLLTAAGNSVMELLFLGLDVTSLGGSPFEPVAKSFKPVKANSLGLTLSQNAIVITTPLIGGFVGGDITAGVVSGETLLGQLSPSLLLDIGTNGEMVLSCEDGSLLATATAAGPALEGSGIEQGMIAARGAIERLWQNEDGNYGADVIGNVKPVGLCGSGLVDAIALLLDNGKLKPTGKLSEKKVELLPVNKSGRGEPIVITQSDVRQVQLAVGAIRTGVSLLLNEAGYKLQDLKQLLLAGGFGNYIHKQTAQRIGLLPKEPNIIPVKNTSLSGAVKMLCKKEAVTKSQTIATKTKHLDLSQNKNFAQTFANAMMFPDR